MTSYAAYSVTVRRATTIGRHSENGLRIFRARRRKGLSQVALGEAAGISHRQIVRLENGEHLPSGEHRDRIAEALGVDRQEIQSSDDDEESDPLPPDLVEALQIIARYTAITARQVQ